MKYESGLVSPNPLTVCCPGLEIFDETRATRYEKRFSMMIHFKKVTIIGVGLTPEPDSPEAVATR